MDIRKVKKLIELLEESGVAEIEIKEGEEAVRISRGSSMMAGDSCGLKSPCAPWSSAWSSGHRRMAPPQGSSGMPRCSLYQAASRVLSVVDLKKTPPMPVTRAMRARYHANRCCCPCS